MAAPLRAVEPGFTPLLDRDHTDGWQIVGPSNGSDVTDGVLSVHPQKPFSAYFWYARRQFTDFILRLEFKITKKDGNSGVPVRFPFPGNDGKFLGDRDGHYEIDVSADPDPLQVTGAIMFVKAPTSVPQKLGDWNTLEIAAMGQSYRVTLNGQLVNEFVGNRSTSGFIGLQIGRKGVQFRNVRINDLSAVTAPVPLATIQTDASQPRIEVIKNQGPNAMEWALTPLEESIPGDIRQNLMFLREDLLDESKKAPKAPAVAYTTASEYCDKILNALDQRDLARVNAGYTAAQANANIRVTSQALEAHRNYQMSWPQYVRENDQRNEILRQQNSGADVKKERVKVDWAARAVKMRVFLDDLYGKLRAAMR